jgi:hypothetical protein
MQRFRRFLLLAGVAAGGFFASGSALAAYALSFTPDVTGVRSQTVSTAVRVSPATDVLSFNFAFDFDPAVLAFAGAAPGSLVPNAPGDVFTVSLPAGTSRIDVVGSFLDPGVPGAGPHTLVLLDFAILAAAPIGPTQLRFLLTGSTSVNDEPLLAATDGVVTVQDAATVIPEPSTWLLLAGGLAWLAAARARRPARA